MKIGPLDNPAVASAVNERKPGSGAQPAAGPAAGDASARVALSSTAAQLATQGGEAVFDADKVARIADAIRDGSFRVNPEAIADKLIANAQELLGSVSRQ